MDAQQLVPHGGVAADMTVDEILAMKPEIVVVPLGSTEPHGSHLPMGTDSYEVWELSRRGVEMANKRGARALLYPVLPITNNSNMRKVPFALRIGIRTLMDYVIDIAKQCKDDGIKKMVLVNGHGGNPPAVTAVLREMASMDDMPFICLANGWEMKPPGWVDPTEHPSMHSGENESSRMLYLRPDLVHPEKFGENPLGKLKVQRLEQTFFIRPWHVFMPNFAGGETRKATAEKGRQIIEAESRNLAELLVELSAAEWTERFPYE